MTRDAMDVLALEAIEAYAEYGEDATTDEIYWECYTLAFDALEDAGVEWGLARDRADRVARLLTER